MIDILLTLLHSERPKLFAVLAFLSAVGLNESKIRIFFPSAALLLRPQYEVLSRNDKINDNNKWINK